MQVKAVLEGNDPARHHAEVGPGELTMADLYRMMTDRFDRSDNQFDKRTGNMRVTNQRLAGLEHDARQVCLAKEADVEPDTKTRRHTEGASAADRVKSDDISSTRVDGGPTSLTSFGLIAKPQASEK